MCYVYYLRNIDVGFNCLVLSSGTRGKHCLDSDQFDYIQSRCIIYK